MEREPEMNKSKLLQLFPFSWRDLLISAGLLSASLAVGILMRLAGSSDGFASPIFMLAILLISRLTSGYLFGLLSAALGVVCINYVFTYPYFAFNFTISGYPLTFLSLLTVSAITCALTTRIKQQDRLRTESEKEKMRADLLRSVSHDIRTPLTSIVGATSAILDNPTLSDTEVHGLLEDVRGEAQWLIRVVENLLSITRMGDEQAHISKEPEAAEEVLSETVRKFRKRFPQIHVKVESPRELLLVPMDAILIEQVLSNLLENAVIHGKGTTCVWLQVRAEEKYACFSVRDNGVGISADKLPTLFNGTLHHAHNERGDGKRNMGLGLTVSLAIVRAHGGTMQAHNLREGGAELSFRLPLVEEDL